MRLLLIVATLPLLACAPQDPAPASAEAPRIPAAEQGPAAAPSASAPLYVDVRTSEEFASGHVAGALHIPYDQMAERWEELAGYRDRPVVLYCRSGRRSGIAQEVLRERGFTRTENGGAFTDLEASGVPTAR
jgi:phage shock protein E